MLIATQGSVSGECPATEPSAEVILPGERAPEWHSLRLFGRHRHSDVFDAGAGVGTAL